MTGGVSPSPEADGGAAAPAEVAAVLNGFDWQLAEIGRRQHRFNWLRVPDSGEWLVCDAYYPGNRVVVIGGDPGGLQFARLAAAQHGLFVVGPTHEELVREPGETAKAMRARLVAAGWQPRAAGDPSGPDPATPPVVPAPAVTAPRPVAPAPAVSAVPPVVPAPAVTAPTPVGPAPAVPGVPMAAPVVPHAPAVPGILPRPAAAVSGERPWWMDADLGPITARADGDLADDGDSAELTFEEEFELPPLPKKPPPPVRHTEGEGMWLGIALGAVVLVESLVAIGTVAIGDHDWLLAIGLLLDATARVAGTLAAGNAGDLNAAWTALLFGSPALLGLEANDLQGNDSARVAQATAVVAGIAVLLGALVAVL